MTSLALLPNLMGPDGLIIFLFILLFFGAKRLPELAKGLGSAVREFSKAKDEIEHEITRTPAPRIEPPRDTQPHLTAAQGHEEHYPSHEVLPTAANATAHVNTPPAAMTPETAPTSTEDQRRHYPAGDPMV